MVQGSNPCAGTNRKFVSRAGAKSFIKAMRRPLLAGALVVIVVAGLLVAYGSIRFRVASASQPGGAYLTALISGVFEGTINPDGMACMWVQVGDSRTAISWPYGYSAGGWPLGIYDQSRRRLASVGEQISVGGGLLPSEMHSILGCSGFTEYWLAAPGPLIGSSAP